MEERPHRKIIAIDFDDTITTPSPYPITGSIRPEAIDVIKKLQRKYICCLWTCRAGKHLAEAVSLLATYGVVFEYVNTSPIQTGSPKIIADYYIDDKAFGSTVDWYKIEQELL